MEACHCDQRLRSCDLNFAARLACPNAELPRTSLVQRKRSNALSLRDSRNRQAENQQNGKTDTQARHWHATGEPTIQDGGRQAIEPTCTIRWPIWCFLSQW